MKNWTTAGIALCNRVFKAVSPSAARAYSSVSSLVQEDEYPCYETSDIPTEADVLICGGGLCGLSAGYHLAKNKCYRVVLIEQGRLGGGGTWLSSGLLMAGHILQDPQLFSITTLSNELFRDMAAVSPLVDYTAFGRLHLAFTDATVVHLQRIFSFAKAHRKEVQMMTPKEVHQICSDAKLDNLKAGLWINDAKVNQLAVCHALAKVGTEHGLKIIEQCPLRSIVVNKNCQVEGVETRYGLIRCKHFINAAGCWAGSLPCSGATEQPSIRLPLQECLYSYMITEPFENVPTSAPIIHDMDLNVYVAHYEDRVLCGGFDRHAFRVVYLHDLPSSRLNFRHYSEDWDTFTPVLEKLTKRFPALMNRNVKKLISGVDTFTPDGYPIVGPLPEISNYYCATGMNGCGTALAPGLGRIVAEWVADEAEPSAITRIDVARFISLHANKFYLSERAPEVAGTLFKARSQSFQWSTARKVRLSPIHQHLKNLGGVFGEIMGYERALFFAKDKDIPSLAVGDSYPLGRPVWFKYLVSEYEACRERVAIMDMSSYTKLHISGLEDDVVKFLQKLSSANIDVPVGGSVYTGMQNESGGYVTDCTLNRFGRNQYFMVAPSVQQTRSRLWLEKHLDVGSTVIIHDVTSMYMTLCVVGPASRLLLQELTDESLSGSNFPMFTCKEINIGFASGIKAVCITHCGELGWTLYIPNEFAQYCFEQLLHHGKSYGLQLAGYYALRTLRIEKFYVYWGTDIDANTSPAECGRLFRVNFNKDFIGKQALLREKEHGVRRLYVQLLLKSHNLHADPWPQGNEPIYRDGLFCGFTTSSAYAFTLGCQVCLGYIFKAGEDGLNGVVTTSYICDPDAKYEVEIADRRFPARVSLHSPSLPMISSEHPDHYRPTQ